MGGQITRMTQKKDHAQCNILKRNQTYEFGNNTIIFEKFKKKMFDFMCHMIGCNDSSG